MVLLRFYYESGIMAMAKLIVGLTDSKDPMVRALVEKGQFPQTVETPTTVYYLHVTPTFVPAKN